MGQFIKTVKTFPKTFWIANTMELFERWAYYGLFILLGLYFTGPVSEGALGFSHADKAALMAILGTTVYLLPFFTGAIADHYGYKKVLLVSYILLVVGYFLLGQLNSFWSIAVIMVFIAIGAALFKPVISATIAKTTRKTDASISIGFGIFYMIVNVGALVGQLAASEFREKDWSYIFIASSSVILINIILLFFYKEPEREKSEEPIFQALKKVLNKIKVVFSDAKFMLFLLIISGFWSMYMQLFYSMPNFIEQWIDTRGVYNFIENISPGIAQAIGTEEGIILPEKMLSLDTFYIVLFQVLISSLVIRFKPLKTMISGILIASIGIDCGL
jgi:POT family proton-dependent oligopeptide transporter